MDLATATAAPSDVSVELRQASPPPPPAGGRSSPVPVVGVQRAGLCDGAASFNAGLAAFCLVAVVAPVLLITFGFRHNVTALVAIGLIAGGSGVLWIIYVAWPLIRGVFVRAKPPPFHSAFKRAKEGKRVAATHQVRRVHMVVNPFGGGGKAKQVLEAKVLPVFRRCGVEVHVAETTHAGHATDLARTLPKEGFDGLCVIGGDGSLHEVVNGTMQRADHDRMPLGFIPGGSGNSVMLDLGCWDPVEATERICRGEISWIDLIAVTDARKLHTFSVNGVFWGLIGEVGVNSERACLRSVFKEKRYDVVGIWSVLKGQTYTAKVFVEGKELPFRRFTTLFVNNTQHFGKALRATPDAYLDDGFVDCCFLPAGELSAAEKLQVFQELPKGAHRTNPVIQMQQVQHIRLESGSPVQEAYCNIDGETMKYVGWLDMSCLHKAVQIFAPPEPPPLVVVGK